MKKLFIMFCIAEVITGAGSVYSLFNKYYLLGIMLIILALVIFLLIHGTRLIGWTPDPIYGKVKFSDRISPYDPLD